MWAQGHLVKLLLVQTFLELGLYYRAFPPQGLYQETRNLTEELNLRFDQRNQGQNVVPV